MNSLSELISSRIEDQSSAPGRRADRAQLALAIEGGGMSGAVSGGMCLFLERAGYTRIFDHIYGCSAGALNGSYTALGQASEGIKNYLDMSGRLLQPSNILRGRPPLALKQLFEGIISRQRPLRYECRAAGPEFSALTLSPADYQLQVRNDFSSGAELAQLVRASCTMPLLAGGPTLYRGQPLFDGGLIESIPAFSAIRAGATHVLVFRSQSAEYRKSKYPWIAEQAVRLHDRTLAQLLAQRPMVYNQEAEVLENQQTALGSRCQQITIKDDISGPSLALNPARREVESWIAAGQRASDYFFRALIK
jgi:predicted patatin/cPLA2 family phospholipase